MFFAITYDISDSNEDHTAFFERIQQLGAWMHYIEDTWILSTQRFSSSEQIFAELEPLIDKKEDYVLVVRIDASDRQGWLPERAWDWFNEHNA